MCERELHMSYHRAPLSVPPSLSSPPLPSHQSPYFSLFYATLFPSHVPSAVALWGVSTGVDVVVVQIDDVMPVPLRHDPLHSTVNSTADTDPHPDPNPRYPHWGKVPLAASYLQRSYPTLLFLDADTTVVRASTDNYWFEQLVIRATREDWGMVVSTEGEGPEQLTYKDESGRPRLNDAVSREYDALRTRH